MTESVREAAERLVSAFGEGRLDDYFACFSPNATFLFHTTDRRLGSLDEYRALWDRWVQEDGFRVLACSTFDTFVQELGDTAILAHSVETRVATTRGEETLHERETIVFALQPEGRWLAVHEHLSPAPA